MGSRKTPGQAVDEVFASMTSTTLGRFPSDPSTLPISSPWSDRSNLDRIIAEDVFGAEPPINTRTAAMRIPAIARGRNLLVSTIARLPMVEMLGETTVPVEQSRSWLYRTDTATTPQHRLAWTVDDLVFYGWSCWAKVVGHDGFPLDFVRVNQGEWEIDADNRVRIHGVEARPDQVLLIPGLHEGILSYGTDALRDARDLYSIVRTRLRNPHPPINLQQQPGTKEMTETEIDALVDRWASALKGGRSGVGFSNAAIKPELIGGTTDSQLLIEARNAAAVDMARILGVSASRIDATAPKASLNYETTTGRNQELVDFDLALYLTPITARLSLDDVVPRGHRVAFDLSDLTGPTPRPTGPKLED